MQKKKQISYRKVLKKTWAYTSLTIGAIIFLIPFFWLVTTSMKSTEEYKAQPPKWLPPLPYPAEISPFVADNEFTDFPKPVGVSEETWQNMKLELVNAAWQKMNRLPNPTFQKIKQNQELFSRIHDELKQTLVNAILYRIIQELRDQIYEKGAYEIIAELNARSLLTPAKIKTAWSDLIDFNLNEAARTLPIDALQTFQPPPKAEELYLAAWNVGIEYLGGYRWEDSLKVNVDKLGRELWNPLIRFYGKQLWEQVIAKDQQFSRYRSEPEMIQTILQGLTADRLEKNLVKYYRNIVVGKLTVQSKDEIDYPVTAAGNQNSLHWVDEDQQPLTEFFIDGKACVELPYDFTDENAVRYRFYGQLALPFDQIERIILPIRGDLSFHDIWMTIETGGKRYVTKEPFMINDHIWIGAIWQQGDETNVKKSGVTLRGQQIINFTRDRSRPGKVREPDRVLFTLTTEEVPYLVACWRKLSLNYIDTFRFVSFVRFFVNSTILTILNIGAQLLVCPLIAYGFARIKWPGRNIVFGLVLATMMLPHQVTMIPQFLIFRYLGMYDTLFPLWLPSLFGTGFYIFLLRQFFMSIPYDYEEAAKLDGCGFIRRYFNISLPLIRPALAAVVIFQFMATWNDFLRPLIFLNSEEKIPLPLGLYMFKVGWWNQEFGLLMAAAVIMVLPVIIVFFMAQRHFIESISLTGAKG